MTSRLKSFLIEMQMYGNKTDWINANKNIDNYLSVIKMIHILLKVKSEYPHTHLYMTAFLAQFIDSNLQLYFEYNAFF